MNALLNLEKGFSPQHRKEWTTYTTQYFKHVQHNQVAEVKEILHKIREAFHSELLNSSAVVNLLLLKPSFDSALHVSVRLGPEFLPLVRFLVEEEHANFEQSNSEGKTALHDASQFCNLPVVTYLLEKGARVNVVKRADWTPLMLACTKAENQSVIELLLEKGADLFFVNKDGWNCCHLAAREGNAKIVKILIQSAKDEDRIKKLVNLKSRNGRKPLHTAVMHGHLEVTKLLIEHSSEEKIKEADHCGTTPLMDACRCGFLDIVHLFVTRKGGSEEDLLVQNKTGQNCLHVAAETGQSRMVQELVTRHGMNVNFPTDRFGKLTALHWAAKEGHADTVKVLLRLGASPSALDDNDRTALDLAEVFGKAEKIKPIFENASNAIIT